MINTMLKGPWNSNPRDHDLQHPWLGKSRRGLQIIYTRMGFPCSFHNAMIYSINLTTGKVERSLSKVGEKYVLLSLAGELL